MQSCVQQGNSLTTNEETIRDVRNSSYEMDSMTRSFLRNPSDNNPWTQFSPLDLTILVQFL